MNSAQSEFFPVEKPEQQLRVSSFSNEAARAIGLTIPHNMRVPKGSIISEVYESSAEFDSRFADENLNWWRSSKGGPLRHANIRVEAMKVMDRVWAIVTLNGGKVVSPKLHS